MKKKSPFPFYCTFCLNQNSCYSCPAPCPSLFKFIAIYNNSLIKPFPILLIHDAFSSLLKLSFVWHLINGCAMEFFNASWVLTHDKIPCLVPKTVFSKSVVLYLASSPQKHGFILSAGPLIFVIYRTMECKYF